MIIEFGKLTFEIEDQRVKLKSCGSFQNKKAGNFVEVQVAGENKISDLGVKMAGSSEGRKFQYVSHEQTGNLLKMVQESDLVRAETVFEKYDDTNALRVYTTVTNVSAAPVVLEEVSAFVAKGLGTAGVADNSGLYFTRFVQSHHGECQPRRKSFQEWGFCDDTRPSNCQKRIAFANVGSWSTKEELPQGILEDISTGDFTMFQIESNAAWYYEISDWAREFYLWLGSACQPFVDWSKCLKPGEEYSTCKVALAFGRSLNEVVGEMTKYRRKICSMAEADSKLPTIFNEYMHLSWDSPTEEHLHVYAPAAAKTGVDYYVIDCGWHNEEPGDQIYPYVGQWRESKSRFPNGVRAATDYIRSLGMKAGLWIEPEIVGIRCKDMLDYYDESCLIRRHGKPVVVHNRYFLDYRNEKVRAYMTETIRRMVEDYGADYIKFDYNQDLGVGTDVDADSLGEGLEQCAAAFLAWVDSVKKQHPGVIWEACASGGMRMDYRTLSKFSLVSTSDQIDYLKYPYIAANILSAVLPEQAAVWSYPVGQCTKEEINDDQIVMNMINSFLGRMHLASHLEWMTDHQIRLVKEGVEVYNRLIEKKGRALPIFPMGFTSFGKKQVCAGLQDGTEAYLGVWCLGETLLVDFEMDADVTDVGIVYPSASGIEVRFEGKKVCVWFEKPGTAVFLRVHQEEK